MIRTAEDIKNYKKQLRESLNDQFLRRALDAFFLNYKTLRSRSLKDFDYKGLKKTIIPIKDNIISSLDELYHRFKENAERVGAKVHLAKNAEDANRIIAEIARENGAKNIVKSKSMTTEETFLNRHLEQEGFKVTETDLGEWIIQLRGEGPSHMVAPAIHLSAAQVAELFTEVTGERQDPQDIGKLVKVARQQLRRAFIEADMGISGANLAVAQTGTIALVTNEGNARLTTTLPRVHVALLGLEKLVPDLEFALDLLRMLPRSAFGQAITSYVTWITGAVECGTSSNGRKSTHFVFLDNGRSSLAKDPVFSSVLRCMRCGACANVCPVYRLVGGHKLGHVYIGAVGLILTYFYHGRQKAGAIVRNCLNCQACREVCPVEIDLPYLIKQTRKKILKKEGRPLKNKLLSALMKNRSLFHFLLRQARMLQKPLGNEEGFIRHLPLFFKKDQAFRRLPAIADIPFRDQWQKLRYSVENPRLRVTLFAGCMLDFIYPEQGRALLKLLEKHRVRTDFPLSQTCCGLPLMMASEDETAVEIALQNLEAVNPEECDYILTLCPSCGSHLKENYPKLLRGQDKFGSKLESFTSKIIDFSSFMIDVLAVSADDFQGSKEKVAYHASCHLTRGLKVRKAPRRLIGAAGFQYAPGDEEEFCCGFGGSYSFEFPEVSSGILEKKLDDAEKTGAGVMVADCPGCVTQLRGGAKRLGMNLEVKHIVELFSHGLPHCEAN